MELNWISNSFSKQQSFKKFLTKNYFFVTNICMTEGIKSANYYNMFSSNKTDVSEHHDNDFLCSDTAC